MVKMKLHCSTFVTMFCSSTFHLYGLLAIVFLAAPGLSLTNVSLPLPDFLRLPPSTVSTPRYARSNLETRSASCSNCDGSYTTYDNDFGCAATYSDANTKWTCVVWQDGIGYCQPEGRTMCCDEGLIFPVSCPSNTHCVYNRGLDSSEYSVSCISNDQFTCPMANYVCPIGKSCCGKFCADSSAGDICCGSEGSSSSYVCKSGQQCSAKGCIPVPTETIQIGSWKSQGCYSDTVDVRTLNNYHATTTGLTIEECVQAAAGYKYAGVEYGEECWFGNEFSSIATQQSSGCNMPCSGDSSLLCGGDLHINIYLNEVYIEKPTLVQSSGSFRSQGCYSDTVDVRTLNNYHATTTGLTIEECVQAAAGYKYAGVEYGEECWFGNELSSIATQQSSGCNMPCSGDSSSLCGGDHHINIYLNEAYTEKPILVQSSGSFRSQGCFADDSNARLLNSGSFTDAAGMTVAQCVGLAGSSKYAAVEFHSECYWGNTLFQSQVSDDRCDAACAGDSKTLCGGTWAANLYQNENFSPPTVLASFGNFQSRGCYQDSSKPRLVSSGHTTDDASMTVEKCIGLAGSSFKYVAIEFHGECYWGNTLTNSKVDESHCDAACAGDSAHLCGGTWVANVYENSLYKSPEELSREAVLVLIEQYQALMTKLNNDVEVWRQAIQNEASTNGKRSVKVSRALTATQAYTVVEEDIAALEAFTNRVGSIRLRGGETVAIEMQPLAYVEATVEGNIASVQELTQYGSVDNLLVAEIAQAAAGAATNAVAAGQVAVAIASGLGILGLLAAAFAAAVMPGGGNSGGETPTFTTTTSSQSSTSTTSACTYTPTASIQNRALFCDDRCLVGVEYDETTQGDGDGADGNLEKRGILEERFITIKNLQPYCPFSWSDQWIPHPSTNPSLILDANGNPTGAEALPIVKFLDMDLIPLNIPNGFCSWGIQPHATRQSYSGVNLNEYHTEHVFEKHFVSSFLKWVVAGGIANCNDLSLAFWEVRNEPDADNSVQNLASQLTWWKATDNMPIDNGVERFHEFFILEKHINQAKTWVLHAGIPTDPSPLGVPAGDYQEVFKKLRLVSLVFQYLRRGDVTNAYTATFNRFHAYLTAHSNSPAVWVPAAGPWQTVFQNWRADFFAARQAQVLTYRAAAIPLIEAQLPVGTPQRISFDLLVANGPLSVAAFTFPAAYTV